MYTKQVAVSGTVGKQVFAANNSAKCILRGIILSPLSANGYIMIRHGNASGDIIVNHSALANDAWLFAFPGLGIPLYRGVHVKVLGASAVAYLILD